MTFPPHTRCVGIQEGAFIFLRPSALHSSDGTESDFQVVRLGQNKFRMCGGGGTWTGHDHVVKATIVMDDGE